MAFFLGEKNAKKTMFQNPSIFVIILALLLPRIHESKAQCLKISKNISFMLFFGLYRQSFKYLNFIAKNIVFGVKN